MLRTELEFGTENATLHHKSYRDKLLIPDHPLQVLPRLAVKIGLNEAVILQQVHYWISNPLNQNVRDGRVWVYNTYREWRKQFPFWGNNTIIRAIESLEKRGLLISGWFNKSQTDRTKWYTIDYEALNNLELGESAQNECVDLPKMGSSIHPKWVNGATQNGYMEPPKMGKCTITETTTEITTESIQRSLGPTIKKSFDAEFDEFWSMYPKKADKHKCSKIYQDLLAKGGISLHEAIIHSLSGQNRERELNDELGEWQALPKNPQTWLNGRCWEDKFKTEEQVHEDHRRNVRKINNQPARMSKDDRYHAINAQVRDASDRRVQELDIELARIAADIERTEIAIERAEIAERAEREGFSSELSG